MHNRSIPKYGRYFAARTRAILRITAVLVTICPFNACGSNSAKQLDNRRSALKPLLGQDATRDTSTSATSAGSNDIFNSAPSCGKSYAPGRSSLHLLSTEEYDNTTSDLFFTSTMASKIAIFESAPKGQTGFASDTGNFPLTALTVSKYWDAATALADELIKSKGKANGAYAAVAPCAVDQAAVAPTCSAAVIRSLGLRAWRRPLTDSGATSEVARLQAIVNAAGSFDEGLIALVQALLISPNFLFLGITSDESATAGASFPLSQHQLASRLSYYLWGTTPDTELLELAGNGALASEATLSAQVERLLRSPRANHISKAILNDWVGADTLVDMVTPSLNSALKASMIRETELLIQDIVQGDKSLINLTAAKYSYMNKALADHYGLPFGGANPAQYAAVDLSQTPRHGVLSQASFLLATAGSTTETRPVKRGQALANNWTCSDVPPPPPGVPPLDSTKLPANATPRQTLEVHTNNPACAGCHKVLDPLGLGFESFDSFGKWRTTYDALAQAPIDSSGEFSDGFKFKNTEEMLSYLATSSTVKTCMTRKMLELAVSRRARTTADQCVSKEIGQAALSDTSKFSDLIKMIVLSRQFGMQSGATP